MINFLLSFYFLTSSLIFATAETEPNFEDNIKSCLAAIYTAEKAYHEENKNYSDDFEKIGFDPEVCDFAEFLIESYKNKFTAIAFNKQGDLIGAINSDKEITLYKN